MEKKTLNMEKIAKDLGISKTTVSRALSGKGRISQDTSQRVLDYIAREGGQVRTRSLPQRTPNHVISLVIPHTFMQLDLPFLRNSMGGICRLADQRGYDVLLCYADERRPEQLKRQLKEQKMDGLILSRSQWGDVCQQIVQESGIPYVVMGNPQNEDILYIDHDQKSSSMELTRLLLKMGAKRIAYFTGSLNNSANRDRFWGYRNALEEAGIPFQNSLVCWDADQRIARIEHMELVLEQKPDCILCCDDDAAMKVLRELNIRGIRVPEDIRLASLYDSEVLKNATPSVTAVRFESGFLGAAACRMLLDSLSGKDVKSQLVQEFQIIVRDSAK